MKKLVTRVQMALWILRRHLSLLQRPLVANLETFPLNNINFIARRLYKILPSENSFAPEQNMESGSEIRLGVSQVLDLDHMSGYPSKLNICVVEIIEVNTV